MKEEETRHIGTGARSTTSSEEEMIVTAAVICSRFFFMSTGIAGMNIFYVVNK